jgi:hypothetical protein
MDEKKSQMEQMAGPGVRLAPQAGWAFRAAPTSVRPPLPAGAGELFLPAASLTATPGRLVYHPSVAALGQVAIFDNKLGLSSTEFIGHFLELGEEMIGFLWDKAARCSVKADSLLREPEEGALFFSLPNRTAQLLKSAGDDYGAFLNRTFQLSLWKSRLFGEVSKPGESERDFRLRLGQLSREKRDAEIERLRQRYGTRFAALERQVLTAQQRLDREQEQYKEQMAQTTISIGATILGSILGRKASQIGRAATSARSASRTYSEKMDIQRARQQLELARSRRAELEKQIEEEAARITSALDQNAEILQPVALRPKRKDVIVQWSGLLWLPYRHLESGAVEAGFRLA